jgi:hypothetical protein
MPSQLYINTFLATANSEAAGAPMSAFHPFVSLERG